jgi:class 3 adenylate cyclase/predicted ATPase
MVINVTDWLRSLGLEQYAEVFRDNDLDGVVLPEVNAEDLIAIGITSIGHRRKLLAAIAALKSEVAPTAGAGASVDPVPTLSPISTVRSTDAERRQLTVMFCDLVGSTALSAQLDPEELSNVISAFQKACASAVSAFGGSIAKYMGDGALVYFGYPEAHEDDAERAVRAGLALLDAMAAMQLPAQFRPQIRIGIATGLVVVGELIGDGAAQERVAVGETLNLAARIQSAASPNSIAIGELTFRLAGAAFEYEDLGPHEFKGISGAVRMWRVVGESGARGRFDTRVVKGLTPLVGRAEELDLLRRRWEDAKDGDGQLILLSAPAGFGKSRMTEAFREHIGDPSISYLQYLASPFYVNSPFYPFIKRLEWTAGIVRTDTDTQKLDKLEAVLQGSAENKHEAAPLLAALLSIPFGGRYPPLQINELVQKQKTMQVLEEQLILLSSRCPVLVVFEDAHWIDRTSLELMDKIVRRVADIPIMIVVTYRPEFTPRWLDLGHVTVLRLNQLARSQVVDLIQKAAGGKTLPEAIAGQIADKSGGIPLFVEEITRSILESGDLELAGDRYVLRQSVRDFSIPSTLQDSLIARLDRLGSAKDVVLAASIIGREFSYELIEAISPVPQATLLADLDRLVQSDLLGQRGTPSQSRYIFKHALIRDAAYQSVLNARKRELHQRIAEVLVSRFPEVAETEPELLAHHYTEANIPERALTYWRQAAERATARMAHAEALGHVGKANKLVATLPAGAERDEWELAFLVIDGALQMTLHGWESPEASRVYEAARVVAERLGRPAELFPAIWGLWLGAHSSGQHARAHKLYQEMFELLKQTNEVECVVQANHAGCTQMLAEGLPRAALDHIEELLSKYRFDVHRDLGLRYGAHDPGCCGLSNRAFILVMMGYLDQAEADSAKALELSERVGHKPSVAHTCQFRGEYDVILNRPEQAMPYLETCMSLSDKYSLAAYHNAADLMQGFVRVSRGEVEAGVRQAEAALETLMSIPSRRFHLPIRMSIVGHAKARAGDTEGALAIYEAALDATSSTGEIWYEPETLRLKAEALLALPQPRTSEAEQCLQAAIASAQKQDAKFWELRAASVLAGLWARQGRRAEARGLLAPVYGWFSEGFGNADVKNAAALLTELA